jgi:hypothetical protein
MHLHRGMPEKEPNNQKTKPKTLSSGPDLIF